MFGIKRLSVTLVVALMAVTFAACGSDDEETPTAEATGALEKCDGTHIKFQLSFFPNAQYAPFLVAANRGIWKDLGVDVEVLPGGPNISAATQLGQGLADMAFIQFDEAQNVNLKGGDLAWVSQVYQQSPTLFVARKETKLSEPADLEGKVINGNTGSLDPELHTMLKMAGLSDDDVKLVPSNPPSVSDLLDKNVDVYQAQRFFHVAQFKELGANFPDDFNVLDPNQLGAAIASHGIAVSRDFLNENPDAVACFLAGAVEATKIVLEDPDGAVPDVDAMQQKGLASTEANKTNVAETIKLMTTRADGSSVEPLSMDMTFLKESQDKLVDAGVLPEKPDLDSFVDPVPLQRATEFVAKSGS